jgi:hypothetical protein
VQDAGVFAVVVECVPAPVARAITEALEVGVGRLEPSEALEFDIYHTDSSHIFITIKSFCPYV